MPLFSLFNWFGARPYWLSLFFTFLLILWMATGEANDSALPSTEQESSSPLVKVQVTRMNTELVMRAITLYGRSEPNRSTVLRAEVSGKINKLHAKRGSTVEAGQKIGHLEFNDKKLQLVQAKSLLRQKEIEYKGSKSLAKKGYQGKVRLAEAEASRDLAKALVSQLELALKKTLITAPYHGVLNERFVELGDYVGIGDPIATITDIDPIVVRTNVTERDVSKLALGQVALVAFIDAQQHQGKIRYISAISDPATNTFKVEVELPNPAHQLLAGLSARVEFPLAEVEGLKATPAILAIADDGTLGVKTVENSVVVFTPIQLISSDDEGVWLSGFSKQADVITVGQGFVRPGDRVEVQYRDEAPTLLQEPKS